jgi:hypothetical protein
MDFTFLKQTSEKFNSLFDGLIFSAVMWCFGKVQVVVLLIRLQYSVYIVFHACIKTHKFQIFLVTQSLEEADTASLLLSITSGYLLYSWEECERRICTALIKKIKIFLLYKEIQRDRVKSHIWLTASSDMVKYLRISSYIRKPFHIYDFAPDPIWISL